MNLIEFVFDTLLLGGALRVVARIYHEYNIVVREVNFCRLNLTNLMDVAVDD